MTAHNSRSRQPRQPETVATSPRRRPIAPSPAIGNTGPDIHRVPAAGDHRGALVDVGASFFSAVELAALELPGMPKRREHISRLASKQGWQYRDRTGRGGGREFGLSALPAQARNEILRRRIVDQAAKANGTIDKPRAPMATLASMTHRQAERHSARSVVLDAFDAMRAGRSARTTVELFVSAFNDRAIEVDDWVRVDVRKLSRRTLERWLAARTAGEDELLAGRYRGGRRSVFELSQDAADFLLGAHATQPLLGVEELHGLLDTNFPQGLPDSTNGIMLDLPSVATVARFLREWHANPKNAAEFLAFIDPDRSKSHHRFSPGIAAASIVRLNQRWEVDASPADVMCTDGRRNIYVLVDVATRRTAALVTDTTRTAASLLMVARACQAWGVPEELGTDNGPDFRSVQFKQVLRQMGIHHKLAPKYSPERKPFVERVIGSIQHKFMPLMPGYVGSNVAERTQIRSRQTFAARLGADDADVYSVALSSAELQDRLSAWLANTYAHRPHGGLGNRTPHDVAQELSSVTLPRFAEERAIGMLLMPPADGGVRVVGKEGVRVGGLDYWVDRLVPGQRLQVRLDPADMGKLYLYTDTDPWRFVGIALHPELAGLDRAELAGRIRAEQAEVEREARARLRKLVKKANIHSVADRMIGRAPLPIAANVTRAWSTPELEEAARAADHGAAAPASTVVELPTRRPADEETADDRFARAKQLRQRVDAGTEVAADSLRWLLRYEQSPEFRGLKRVEDLPAA